jgi:hypothetical protein
MNRLDVLQGILSEMGLIQSLKWSLVFLECPRFADLTEGEINIVEEVRKRS